MKKEYTASGRQNQKLQTRQKILETARQLMANGKNYTLEDVAQETNISRATIYRYYSHVDLLSAEAVLDMQASTPELVYEGLKSNSTEGKILEVQDFYNSLALNNEAAFRKFLTIVIDNHNLKEGTRGRRRINTLQMVLEEDSTLFTNEEKRRLLNIASVMMGMEPLIVAKDICGLSDADAKETLQWGLQMVLKGIRSK